MPNPFKVAMGGSQAQQGGRRNLAPNLLQYMQNFQGNPLVDVQNKVQSGEWTQEQYNYLHGMAEGIVQKMMGVLPRG